MRRADDGGRAAQARDLLAKLTEGYTLTRDLAREAAALEADDAVRGEMLALVAECDHGLIIVTAARIRAAEGKYALAVLCGLTYEGWSRSVQERTDRWLARPESGDAEVPR